MPADKKGPSRPRSHTIETQHRIAFESLLDECGWIYRRLDLPDYGIDGQVEIFDSGEKSGLAFYVQLRATDEPDLTVAKNIKVSKKELKYYLSKTEPVMVVRYVAKSRAMYWQWASYLKKEGKWAREAVRAFGFTTPNLWSESSCQSIRRVLANERAIVQGTFAKPLKVCLEFKAPPTGFSATTLKAELHVQQGKAPEVCVIENSCETAIASIEIYKDLIHASIGVNRSYTTNYSSYESPSAKSVAADIWCLLGLLLVRSGQQSAGSILISNSIELCGLASIEEFALRFARIAVASGDFAFTYFALINYARVVADCSELVPLLNFYPIAVSNRGAASLNLAVETCEKIIAIARNRFGKEESAFLQLCLARSLPGEMSEKSLAYLLEVEALDSVYSLSSELWRIRAGRLHDLNRLEEASESALRAYELDESPENSLVLVRTLASQCRFEEVVAAFEKLDQSEATDNIRGGFLIGVLCLLIADRVQSKRFSYVEDTCSYLDDIQGSDFDGNVPVAALLSILLFVIDPSRLGALLNGIRGVGAEWLQLGELAIEYGIHRFGSAFPSAMNQFLRENGWQDDIADAMTESFHQKIRQMETGERTKDIRVLNPDGGFTIYARIGESLEWEVMKE